MHKFYIVDNDNDSNDKNENDLYIAPLFIFIFFLKFYDPVNPTGSCQVRSVHLTTPFPGQASSSKRLTSTVFSYLKQYHLLLLLLTLRCTMHDGRPTSQ